MLFIIIYVILIKYDFYIIDINMETIWSDLLILQEKMIKWQATFGDYLEKVWAMVDNHEFVSAPSGWNWFMCKDYYWKSYLALYPHPLIKNKISEKDYIHHIDEVMNFIYRRNDIAWIVFVNDGYLYIDRRQIDKYIKTKKDPRLIKKDWGYWIPDNYRETDILQSWEKYDNIRKPAFEYLKKVWIEVISYETQPEKPINIKVSDNWKICYVKVVFEDEGKMESDIQEMLHLAIRDHVKPLILGVDINPIDHERAVEKLFLVWDDYKYSMRLMQLVEN